MSATRILVLGVVRMHGRAHGYQVHRDLQTWGATQWANLRPGSLYHALRQMAKEKLLEVVDTEEGSGPDRTVYRLTDDGDAEFLRMVADAIAIPSRLSPDLLGAGFCFLPVLERTPAIDLFRFRVASLEGELTTARRLGEGDIAAKPAHVEQMFDLWVRTTEAALAWAQSMVGALEAGRYHLADDGPGYFGEPTEPR